MRHFTGEREGFVKVGREGWILPARYKAQAQGYYSLPLRHDDVWIATFPRSGSHILLFLSVIFASFKINILWILVGRNVQITLQFHYPIWG